MPIQDFSKVELLLSMVGANNGTVFPDSSLRQRAVTRGGVVTSTTRSKFPDYGSSALFNGSTHNLQVDLTAGTDLWTIEGYVYQLSDAPSASCIFDTRYGASNDEGFFFMLRHVATGHVPRLVTYNSVGAGVGSAGSTVYALNAWHHFAVQNNGVNIEAFVDGALEASLAKVAWVGRLTIGNIFTGADASIRFPGNMNDFSVTIGAAKYTDGFTPPARMTQRTLTRVNTGTDSDEYDRAVLFDINGSAYPPVSETPDAVGNFAFNDLIDLEYGVAMIKAGCDPVCRGPVLVDPD